MSEIIGQKNTSVITNKLRREKMALRNVKANARLSQACHPPLEGMDLVLKDCFASLAMALSSGWL